MKVAFCTLGCKVNQTETRDIKNQFIKLGYLPVKFSVKADIYVVNSCSVTHIAERKTRNYIRRAKRRNPRSKIYLCGCYANLQKDKLKKELPEISKVIQKEKKLDIKKWSLTPLPTASGPPSPPLQIWRGGEGRGEGVRQRVRQFLKVEDGCDQFCSYCVIPYARGKVVSLKFASILAEAKQLIDKGAVELVLTGINLGRWHDGQKDLVAFISELEKIQKLKRIRLSSIEPNLVTDKLIKKIKTSKKLCRHLHIPLQSGSETILSLMNRPYSVKEYEQVIRKVRKQIKNIAITTDIIVGFPGETKETFSETQKTLDKIKFADIHLFTYSKRNQTKSANMKQLLLATEIKEMMTKLIKQKSKLRQSYLKKFTNKKVEVLVQEIAGQEAEGLNSEYVLVKFKKPDVKLGEIILARGWFKPTTGSLMISLIFPDKE